MEYLVVGAGFAGSVISERLATERNATVLLVDIKDHIGGSAHDYVDEAGILVHKYGPHIFHTNSKKVLDYLSRFTDWQHYEHRVRASVDGMLLPVPVNLNTMEGILRRRLSLEEIQGLTEKNNVGFGGFANAREALIYRVGEEAYEKIYETYSRKQWGCDLSELDASMVARVMPRIDRDDRYFKDTYQCMPKNGYTALFSNMLNNPKIHVELGTHHSQVIDSGKFAAVIFTGAIDEFFDFRLGRLPYRSVITEHQTFHRDSYQDFAVVNYTQSERFTRITEFKKLTFQKHKYTSIMREYPSDQGYPYYPVPSYNARAQYEQYRVLAGEFETTYFCGRMGTYQYLNMDQAVAQALVLAGKL